MIRVLEYLDELGRSPFGRWFAGLDAQAAARVSLALYRLREGNVSSLTSVGGGISELRIHTGPGYRVYLGRDGPALVILLGGGSKRRQPFDIAAARIVWQDYRRRRGAREKRHGPDA